MVLFCHKLFILVRRRYLLTQFLGGDKKMMIAKSLIFQLLESLLCSHHPVLIF